MNISRMKQGLMDAMRRKWKNFMGGANGLRGQ
ncbi:MAG: hypothetical protein JWO08_3579 [Verrucomicrobiaceae bacterium]|nr:hypothetical protein [Verrucomicrobiaceae bacterium]